MEKPKMPNPMKQVRRQNAEAEQERMEQILREQAERNVLRPSDARFPMQFEPAANEELQFGL